MKILVTGGAGFIGSAVIRRAISQGDSIVNVDSLTYAANLKSIDAISKHKNYSFEKHDICDAGAMADVFAKHQPDCILHLAAESHVDRSIDGPRRFMETNVMGTLTLLEVARKYFEQLDKTRQSKFRFHHVSTDEVYGDLEISDPAFTETSSYDPSSPYSASKAASDHLVRAWGRTYGLPIIITSCSNNYGPYQFPEKLIPVVILKALYRQPIPIYGTGDNIRDWLHVDDHARALLTALKSGTIGETYNIGGHNERTNLDIAQTICKIMDKHMDDGFHHETLIEFVTDRPGHDRRYAINADKIEQNLGWTPSMKFNEGFEQTISWYLENETWWRPLIDADKFGHRHGLKASS